MTEAEWLRCDDSVPMLEELRNRAGNRKLRLFAIASCNRVSSLLLDERSRSAIFTAELFADGKAAEVDLIAAHTEALGAREDVQRSSPESIFYYWGDAAAGAAAACAATAAFPPAHPVPRHEYFITAGGGAANAVAAYRIRELEESFRLDELPDDGTLDAARSELFDQVAILGDQTRRVEEAAQADLLRDIFGNPFRPVAFSSAWRTPTVLALAAQVYESRDFSAMPILADALQDAGCDNADILDHCRGAGAHVRGCWVVDLVLGKE